MQPTEIFLCAILAYVNSFVLCWSLKLSEEEEERFWTRWQHREVAAGSGRTRLLVACIRAVRSGCRWQERSRLIRAAKVTVSKHQMILGVRVGIGRDGWRYGKGRGHTTLTDTNVCARYSSYLKPTLNARQTRFLLLPGIAGRLLRKNWDRSCHSEGPVVNSYR